jgi:hypothetical protein
MEDPAGCGLTVETVAPDGAFPVGEHLDDAARS